MPAILGGKVVARGVQQVAVEQDAGAGGTDDRHRRRRALQHLDHLALGHRPEFVRSVLVVVRLDAPALVAAGNHVERAVHLDRIGHHQREGAHVGSRAAVALPRAVVLVPHPHRAFDRGLGVDLGVIDVHVAAERLARRLQHARRTHQCAECRRMRRTVVFVHAEDRAHAARVLADHGIGIYR